MFQVTKEIIASILKDFAIHSRVMDLTELQRYDYEKENPASKEVRLIVKADLDNGKSLVLRFKNEKGVTLEIIHAQSRFARLLADRGVETPWVYRTNGQYARRYHIHGYDVIVTIEDFAAGELHTVDADIAQKTGGLLARMHNIAERADYHDQNNVLFDPLGKNELFSFQDFQARESYLSALDKALYNHIVRTYARLLQRVRIFEDEPKYAVQGDISDCNLYQTESGGIGVFDFNRCGDSVLYYDAVMQAIFEARLMDYPKELSGKQEGIILSAFLKGYHQKRPFTDEQKEVFPCLYAIVSAFWLSDIKWGENSLCNAVEAGDAAAVRQWMGEIYRRLLNRPKMPL